MFGHLLVVWSLGLQTPDAQPPPVPCAQFLVPTPSAVHGELCLGDEQPTDVQNEARC
jgi:hypothetical protein